MAVTVRRRRPQPGWRVCDGCHGLHLEQAFREIIEDGKSKGRLRCAMCVAVELRHRGVPWREHDTPASEAEAIETIEQAFGAVVVTDEPLPVVVKEPLPSPVYEQERMSI